METLGILEILPASLLIEKLTWDHIGHLCLKLQARYHDQLHILIEVTV